MFGLYKMRSLLKHIQKQLLYYYIFILLNSIKMVIAYLLCDVLPVDLFLLSIIIESVCLTAIYYETIFVMRLRLLFVFAYIFQGAIIFINMLYYNVFNTLLPITLCYRLFWEFWSLNDKFMDLPIRYPIIITIIDLPIFLFIYKKYCISIFYTDLKSRIMFLLVLSAIFVLIVLVNSSSLLVGQKLAYLETNVVSSEQSLLHRFGVIAYNLIDLSNTQKETGGATQLDYGPDVKIEGGSAARRNIMLIQVESLDANIIDYAWNGRYVVPFLHRLSRKGIYFPYMMVYHMAGGSSDCEIATLNSVEPMTNSPTCKQGGYDYPNSLVKVLVRNNYKSTAFHGNDGDFYNRDLTFFKMGFRLFYDRLRMDLPEEKWGASDEKVFDYALNKVNSYKDNYIFTYIITLSSHEPFNIVEQYYHDDHYNNISLRVTRRYFQSMTYVDKALEKFLMQVKAIKPDTYIFIFGDHTPYVIKGGPYYPASFLMDHRSFEFVPLIIITPDGKIRQETENAVSLLDIAPTVLSVNGVSATLKSYGENLMENLQKKIPYQGRFYDREVLYSKAVKTKRRSVQYQEDNKLYRGARQYN